MPKLHVIEGGPAPKAPRKRSKDVEFIIECHRCRSRAITEVKIGATSKNGRVTGGTKVTVCAQCLMRGEWVQLP